MTALQIVNTRSLRAEFSTLANAAAYIERCISPSKWATVTGCNGFFWVLSNREASILVKAGYEYAV